MFSLEGLSPIINVIAAVIIAISYVYTTFVTKQDMVQYVDQKHDAAMEVLKQIEKRLESIDTRLIRKGL